MKDAASRQKMAEERYPDPPFEKAEEGSPLFAKALHIVNLEYALRERTAYIAALELCAQREAQREEQVKAMLREMMADPQCDEMQRSMVIRPIAAKYNINLSDQ